MADNPTPENEADNPTFKPTSSDTPENAIPSSVAMSAAGNEVAAEEPKSPVDSSPARMFTLDEETLIIRIYNLVGDRWSLIAGRIPGRSAEEIEKYWNTRHPPSTSYATTRQ